MPEPSPTVLIIETTAGAPPVEFLGETAGLVYFLSMAHSERYGADHPLARAARILKHQLRISLAPLLNFADASVDDPQEEALLERLWQDAGPVAASARAAAAAIEKTPELSELTGDFPELPDRLRELGDIAAWADERGAKMRLMYAL